eukprot:PhF_6_TR7897/c0_g5_i5/m.11668
MDGDASHTGQDQGKGRCTRGRRGNGTTREPNTHAGGRARNDSTDGTTDRTTEQTGVHTLDGTGDTTMPDGRMRGGHPAKTKKALHEHLRYAHGRSVTVTEAVPEEDVMDSVYRMAVDHSNNSCTICKKTFSAPDMTRRHLRTTACKAKALELLSTATATAEIPEPQPPTKPQLLDVKEYCDGLRCKGCNKTFSRACGVVAHVRNGACKVLGKLDPPNKSQWRRRRRARTRSTSCTTGWWTTTNATYAAGPWHPMRVRDNTSNGDTVRQRSHYRWNGRRTHKRKTWTCSYHAQRDPARSREYRNSSTSG